MDSASRNDSASPYMAVQKTGGTSTERGPVRILLMSGCREKWPYIKTGPIPPNTTGPLMPQNIDIVIDCDDPSDATRDTKYVENMLSIPAHLRLTLDSETDKVDYFDALARGEESIFEQDDTNNYIDKIDCKLSGLHYLQERMNEFELPSASGKSGEKRTLKVYALPSISRQRELVDEFPPYDKEPAENMFDSPHPQDDKKEAPSIFDPPHNIPEDVDILITRDAPSNKNAAFQLDRNEQNQHCGSLDLSRAIAKAKPRLHCFAAKSGKGKRGVVQFLWPKRNDDPMTEKLGWAMSGTFGDRKDQMLIIDETHMEEGFKTVSINAVIDKAGDRPILLEMQL